MDTDPPEPESSSSIIPGLLQDCYWGTEGSWVNHGICSVPRGVPDVKVFTEEEMIVTEPHYFTLPSNDALPMLKYEPEPDSHTESWSNVACPDLKYVPLPVLPETPHEISPSQFKHLKLKEPVLRLRRLQAFRCSFCAAEFYTQIQQETHEGRAHAREKGLLPGAGPDTRIDPVIGSVTHRLTRRTYQGPGSYPAPNSGSTNDQPAHKCPMCDKSFSQLLNLHRHLIHAESPAHGGGVKSMECPVCKRHFTASAFSVHSQKCGVQEDRQCKICLRSFCNLQTLNKHIRTCRARQRSSTLQKPVRFRFRKRGGFECKHCDKSYSRPDKLRTHVQVAHITPKRFGCHICGRTFDFPDYLRLHLKKAHKVKFTKCTFCRRTFCQAERLQEHMLKEHTGTEGRVQARLKLQCNLCPATFPGAWSLKRHAQLYHSNLEKFECDVCGDPFASLCRVKQHKKKFHKISPDKCRFCPEVLFGGLGEHLLQRHGILDQSNLPEGQGTSEEVKGNPEGRIECQECGILFLSSDYLTRHVERHHLRVGMSECGICGAVLRTAEILKNHQKRVHGISFEKCTLCIRTFSQPQELKAHILKVHSRRLKVRSGNQAQFGLGRKILKVRHVHKYKCELCPSTFPGEWSLKRHAELVHNSLRTEECDICRKRFVFLRQLKVHKKTVHKVLAEKCGFCNESFFEGLSDHLLQKHGILDDAQADGGCREELPEVSGNPETRTECQICHLRFRTAAHLKRHVQKHHLRLESSVCDICGLSLASPSHLRRHKINVHKVVYEKCAFCVRKISQSDLKGHVLKFHSGNEGQALRLGTGLKRRHKYKCELCPSAFPGEWSLKRHADLEHGNVKPQECNLCENRFKDLRKLKLHKKKFHKLKADKCKLCQEKFFDGLQLRDHLLTKHGVLGQSPGTDFQTTTSTGETEGSQATVVRIECQICHMIFVTGDYLERHVQRHHLKIGSVSCEVCGATLANSGSLRQHQIRVHKMTFENKPKRQFGGTGGGIEVQLGSISVPQRVGILKHKCDICSATFPGQWSLKRHAQLEHSNLPKFDCDACGKPFASLLRLKRHKIKSHKIVPDRCHLCQELFFGGLQDHLLKRHGVLDPTQATAQDSDPHECQLCHLLFLSDRYLRRHVEKLHLKIGNSECGICGATLATPTVLRKHQIRQHGLSFEKCPFCTRSFGKAEELKEHVTRRHGPKSERKLKIKERNVFQCDQCPGAFPGERTLARHVRLVHLNAKKYICDICGAGLTNHANVVRHQSVVHKVSPAKCSLCGQSFGGRIEDHILRRHGRVLYEQTFQYACAGCPSRFQTADELQAHGGNCGKKLSPTVEVPVKVEGTDGGPFACEKCPMTFSTGPRLKKHVKGVHLEVGLAAPAECKLCGQKFTSSIVLNKHRRSDHGLSSEKCPFCIRLFWEPGQMSLHMKEKHGVTIK